MNDRDWVGELSNYLQRLFLRLSEAHSIGELRVNPPLATEEAKYVLLGLESGLFRIDEEGSVEGEVLPSPSGSNFKRDLCQVFVVSPPPPRLVRESICQLATASSLILQRGWLPSQVRMGMDDTATYGVDIIVESAGEIFVCVEIKRSVHELQKFASDFRQCCRRGTHAKADCAFQQNHGIFEFCARYEPAYLWIVAPDGDACFKLNRAQATIEIEELNTLPRRSHIEFGS